jgi:anti-sigma factor RsiW
MSNTDVRGACSHSWLDLPAYAAGSLSPTEDRAVEAETAGCATCFEELSACLEMAALLYEAFAAARTPLAQRPRVGPAGSERPQRLRVAPGQ